MSEAAGTSYVPLSTSSLSSTAKGTIYRKKNREKGEKDPHDNGFVALDYLFRQHVLFPVQVDL